MSKWFLLAYILISVLLFDPKLHLGGDEAVYIILAESLVAGKGYRDIHLVGEPQHKTYPPGWPLLLCPIVLLFGRDLIVLKIYVMLFGLGGLLIFEKTARHLLSTPYDTLAVAFYITVPPLITYNHYCLSEIPYLFFSLAAVWFVVKNES